MGWFGWASSNSKQSDNSIVQRDELKVNPDQVNLDLPADLKQYLESNDSKLSDREFKRSIGRELYGSDQGGGGEIYQKARELLVLSQQKEQQKLEAEQQAQENESPKRKKRADQPYIYKNSQSTEPLDQDQIKQLEGFKNYIRNNGLKESVFVNCTEIHQNYLDCLKEKGRFLTHECAPVSDFHIACLHMQKMAFINFDYDSMDKIDECEVIKYKIDKTFNKHFKSNQDTQDDEKYLQYTRDLKLEREAFYRQFGK